MLDLLLQGGWIVDGLGTPMYRADLGIQAGRIAALGQLEGAEARRVIDCAGLCVSPGWVDLHGHADWSVLDHPIGLNLLVQGCTTTVAGNCGGAPAPVAGRATEMLRLGELRSTSTVKKMYAKHPKASWCMEGLLSEIEANEPGVNYVQLAGHNALRQCVMGKDERPATPSEIEDMGRLLHEAIEQGAWGMSSGLVFIPGCWSETDEVIALARVVAEYDGVYASHIRGERETNIEATQEFIQIAETAGVRAQMSHMQSKWPVYGNAVRKIEMLSAARERGVDVACDSEVFPNWASTAARFLQIYSYSPDELVALMGSAEGRAKLKHTMRTIDPWHPLGRFGPGGVGYRRAWDRISIFDCPHDRSLEGQTVGQVAARRGIEFEDALFDLTVAEEGRGPLLIYDYIEDDHFRTIPWDYCIYPSIDTGLHDPAKSLSALDLRAWRDTGYPGTIGLAPRVLGQFVRDEGLTTVEEAVRRMTSLAMQRVGVKERGALQEGYWADVVVFDKDTIALRSSEADPERLETFYPVGIQQVIVNGQVAMEGHTFTGARAGQVLRKGA